ncbi:hypothetical protein GCM10020000_06180 [Streptomyces olivoverticillatus]
MTALAHRQPDATLATYDAATLAVLHAMEEAAEKHLDAIRSEPPTGQRRYCGITSAKTASPASTCAAFRWPLFRRFQ